MQSAMLKPLTLAMTLLCGACAGSIQVQAPTAGCSTLLADRWRQPVETAVLDPVAVGTVVGAPPSDQAAARAQAEAARWQMFGVRQTGQLSKANGNTADVIETVERCEARDAAAVRQITRPWYARLRPG